MVSLGRAVRLAGVLSLVAVVATPAIASAQTDKAFSLPTLRTDARVNGDGSMGVQETITYQFSGGPFSHGYRTFQPQWRSKIQDFAVSENGQSLTVVSPEFGRRGEWQWDYPETSGRHTFVITYTVPGAAQVGSDVARLYWQFIGDDHPGVGSMTVDIALPGTHAVATPDTSDSDTSVVRAWAHGPRNGVVTPGPSSVNLTVSNVPEKTFVEADVIIPLSGFTAPGTEPLLAKTLAEEKGYLDPASKAANRERNKGILGGLISALGLGGFGLAWLKWGKEPAKPEHIGEYWREPLDDPPAVVASTLGFGSVNGHALGATLVDLAQRGYLTITESGEEGLFKKKPVYTFTATNPKPRVGQSLPPPPSGYEMDLLTTVFQGSNQTTSSEFRDWARANQSSSASFWNGWQAKVSADTKARGYIAGNRGAATGVPVLIIAVLGLSAFLFYKTREPGHVPIGTVACACAAALVIALSPLMRKRSVTGTEQAAKANGLKKYLEDFSNLNDAPIGSLILWERFLVYAVALGCAGKVYDGLKVRLPEVANDPGFAVWYVPTYGHGMGAGLDDFGRDFGNDAATAMTPPKSNSSSGGGGGFSGGGGGGGGGGGFGAD
jgi:uncharacterized membrane protein